MDEHIYFSAVSSEEQFHLDEQGHFFKRGSYFDVHDSATY